MEVPSKMYLGTVLEEMYLGANAAHVWSSLQRAECSEGVRGHVRSRITQQHNQQAQGDSEVTPGVNPSLLTQTAADGTATDVPQCKGHSGGKTSFTVHKHSHNYVSILYMHVVNW